MSTFYLSIEKAKKNDISELIHLRAYLIDNNPGKDYSSKTEADKKIWKEKYREWLEIILEETPGIIVFIAKNKEKIIGCATGIIDRRAPASDCLSGYCGWVQSVVVDNQFRHRGIARSLLEHLTMWFKSNHVSKIILESTSEAEDFYKKTGFTSGKETLFIKKV